MCVCVWRKVVRLGRARVGKLKDGRAPKPTWVSEERDSKGSRKAEHGNTYRRSLAQGVQDRKAKSACAKAEVVDYKLSLVQRYNNTWGVNGEVG